MRFKCHHCETECDSFEADYGECETCGNEHGYCPNCKELIFEDDRIKEQEDD